MQIWKTVRVFISSTFRDMYAERDYLVRFVFPELQERCARRCLHLVDVDLRWGVTEEEARQGRVLEICLDEVERCRPFFIGLLGERYGQALSSHELLDRPANDWLQEFGEGHSLAALEIYHGVLYHPQVKTQAFFYFRDPSFLKDVPVEKRGDFLTEGEAATEKLGALKQKIRESRPVFENYPCAYDEVDENGRVRLAGLEEFGKRVLEDLWAAICEEHPEDRGEIDDFAVERSYHERFIERCTQGFIGRHDVLDKLHAFVESGDDATLVVTGDAGCGKSAVLAKFAREYAEGHPEMFVLTHFVGVSPGSTDVRRTLLRLCRDLGRKFDLQSKFPTDYYDLRLEFVKLLGGAAARGKVLLVVDALNQLDEDYEAQNLDWLPQALPKEVRLIVSTPEGVCLDALRRRSPVSREVSVGPLAEEEQRELIRRTLDAYSKTLDEAQMRVFLAKKESDNPLYLVVACEEMRVHGDFESVSGKLESLANEVDSLFEQVLERIEHDHSRELVEDALTPLECSRHGLLESEVLELLAREGEAQLPQAVWARLYRSLQFYLRPPGENAEGLLDFFHGKFAEAVRHKYLGGEGAEVATHQRLAAYFRRKADPGKDGSWAGSYPRALSELPHHQLAGKLYEDLFRVAREQTFLSKQAAAFANDPKFQSQTTRNALAGATQIDDPAKMVEFLFGHYRQLSNFGEESAFKVFRETGNLVRAVNLCEIWFQRNNGLGSLQFLWLVWELRRNGRIEAANKLLCSLAGRMNLLSAPTKEELQTLATFALCQIFDLDYKCVTIVQDLLLSINDEEKLKLCQTLSGYGVAAADPRKERRVKAALRVALHTASDLYNPHYKAKAYAAIALAQARAGQDAAETFALAEKVAGEMISQSWKIDQSKAYQVIAQAQARAGKVEDALKTAAKITSPPGYRKVLQPVARSQYQKVLQTVANSQARSGRFEDALQTAANLESEFEKDSVYFFIAQLQAEGGKYEDALKTAGMITYGPKDDEVYDIVVQTQMKAGQFEQALETVGNMTHPYWRSKAYAAIAQAQFQAGQDGAAALELAFGSAASSMHPVDTVIAYVHVVQAQMQAAQDATETLKLASRAAQKIDDWERRADAYTGIAMLQLQLGQDATKALDLALRSAGKMPGGERKVAAYVSIAPVWAQAGGDIDAVLDLALETTRKIKDTLLSREWPYDLIAKAQAQAGKYDAVLKTLELLGDKERAVKIYKSIAWAHAGKDPVEVFELAFKLDSSPAEKIKAALQRANAYTAIALTQSQTGKETTRAFEQALKAVEEIDDPVERVKAYALVAGITGHVGGDTVKPFDLALKTVGQLHDWKQKVEAYFSIANAKLVAEEDSGPVCKTALQAAARIDSVYPRDRAYKLIATVQSRAGKYQNALKTAGEIDDKDYKNSLYALIARGQARSGQYQAALHTVARINDEERRVKAYITVLKATALAGEFKGALNMVRKIEDPEERSSIYHFIVKTCAQAGRYDEALKVARKIEDKYWRADGYGQIALEQVKAEKYEEALETLATIDGAYQRAIATESIAFEQAKAGKDSTWAFDLALETAGKVSDAAGRVEAYLFIARRQVQVEKDATKTFDLALRTAEEAKSRKAKAKLRQYVTNVRDGFRVTMERPAPARTQELAGDYEVALNLTQSISDNRRSYVLQRIARASALKGTDAYFKEILLPASYSLSACYEMSGLLSFLYPEQADEIVEVINRES